jgi:hypothetical protein
MSFDNCIECHELDTNSTLFREMAKQLSVIAQTEADASTGQVTSQDAFPAIYHATEEFYRQVRPELFFNCVPLYHSVWKHTIHSACGPGNLHQDAGVQYFAKNGYESKMVNVWICIDRVTDPQWPEDELGLYVIDNSDPANTALYADLVSKGIHVSSKSETTLVDNMQVAGVQIEARLADLRPTTFPYKKGTMVSFSSHLLHGSKGISNPASCAIDRDDSSYRVALSSVWLAKNDLNRKILEWPETAYEELYLWRHERAMWPELKEIFKNYCEKEQQRISDIGRLVQMHLEESGRT